MSLFDFSDLDDTFTLVMKDGSLFTAADREDLGNLLCELVGKQALKCANDMAAQGLNRTQINQGLAVLVPQLQKWQRETFLKVCVGAEIRQGKTLQ